jgi:hypothetical protein
MACLTAEPQPPRRPNIIFVMTDDQRRDAVSLYGNTILKTPNMDRIGKEGVRFDRAFVTNSLCAPSRASYFTGLYSHAHGVTTNARTDLAEPESGRRFDTVTYPGLLRAAGYHTVLVGKWHLPFWPADFDRWVILPGQGQYQDPVMIANGVHLRMRAAGPPISAGERSRTFAPASTPPDSSLTVPNRLPVSTCAVRTRAARTRRPTSSATDRFDMVEPPWISPLFNAQVLACSGHVVARRR